jgi:hypothetical protein
VARTKKTRDHPEMPREIDFRGGQRGRYAEMLARIRIVISKKKPKKA